MRARNWQGAATVTLAALGLAGALVLAPTTGSARTSGTAGASAPRDGTPNVLIDTDICAGDDDAVALGLANVLASQHRINILGVAVDTSGASGAAAVDAINTYYGHPGIPIGTLKPTDNATCEVFCHNYAGYLATHFPHQLPDGTTAPDAVTLYRRLLAAQPDHSVTVLSLGGLTNLRNVLRSAPDSSSPLPGTALVARKVKRTVVMGGEYDKPGPAEFNFALDPTATADVAAHWPGPVYYSGAEVVANVTASTTPLEQLHNPVEASLSVCLGAGKTGPNWDPLPAWYALTGTDFATHGPGANRIDPDGTNHFTSTPDGHQWYLSPVPDAQTVFAKVNAALGRA